MGSGDWGRSAEDSGLRTEEEVMGNGEEPRRGGRLEARGANPG
jgi:hypothetical protein